MYYVMHRYVCSTHVHTYVRAYTCTCIHTHTRTCIHTHVDAYIRKVKYVVIYILYLCISAMLRTSCSSLQERNEEVADELPTLVPSPHLKTVHNVH